MTQKDARPTLTLKGSAFTPEFRAKLNRAAKKAGQTQAAFVAEVLDREATRILTGTPQDTPQDNPPAVLARIEETDRRLDELAELVRRLTEPRRWWQR